MSGNDYLGKIRQCYMDENVLIVAYFFEIKKQQQRFRKVRGCSLNWYQWSPYDRMIYEVKRAY